MKKSKRSKVSKNSLNKHSPSSGTTFLIDNDVRCATLHGDASDSKAVKTPFTDGRYQVLHNDELLGSIFSSLGPRSMGTEYRSIHLLQASLACKDFFHPAMRVLWHSMDSWGPLLKLIPKVVQTTRFWTTETPFDNYDFDRLALYSNIVEHFAINLDAYQDAERISPHLCLLIRQFMPSGLLPSLKILVISQFVTVSWFDAIFFLDLLIPQKNLSCVTITGLGKFTDVSAASILQIAKLRSPLLSGLTLRGIYGNTLLETLKYFPNLQSIDLEFPDNTIKYDFQGPHFSQLTDLSLTGSVTSVYDILNHWFYDAPKLEHLTITLTSPGEGKRGPSHQVLLQMIQHLTHKVKHLLKSLVIHSPSHHPGIKLRSGVQIFSYFGESSWKHLETLSIPMDEFYQTIVMAPAITLIHRSLERLTIVGGTGTNKSPCYNPIPIVLITRFQSLFPNLKSLTAPFSLKMDDVQIECIQRLISILGQVKVRKCHALEELTLLPFATQLLPSDTAEAYSPNFPNATFVFPSTGHHPERIADLFLLTRFLYEMFPHLKKINVDRLYKFVDRTWLDGLEAGVQQFRESAQQGNTRVCARSECSV